MERYLSRLGSLMFFLIISLLVITAGCTFYSVEPRMFHSFYRYELSVKSDEPISNVTIIVPLPVKNDTPTVGSHILTEKDFEKDNVNIEFTQSPKGESISDFNYSRGYQPCFVVIYADQLIPSERGNFLYSVEKDVDIFPESQVFIVNTLFPVGNESLIVPKLEFSWHDPEVAEVWPRNIRYRQNPISQKTMIYTNYSAKPGTKVEIWFKIQGYNSWKQEYDAGMENDYHDYFGKILTGDQSGWIIINGEFQSGNGLYPNYDNPDWQKVLNQTVS
jgi:hypothetical protein